MSERNWDVSTPREWAAANLEHAPFDDDLDLVDWDSSQFKRLLLQSEARLIQVYRDWERLARVFQDEVDRGWHGFEVPVSNVEWREREGENASNLGRRNGGRAALRKSVATTTK